MCQKPALTKLMFLCKSVKTSIIKQKIKKKRVIREIRDINTAQDQEGHLVKTELPLFIFHILKYFTPKGEG